ncbi:MAG TPA: MFS transporter [Clostridia bacterium]|nr:MFS transporter [Clostridia bacterium]
MKQNAQKGMLRNIIFLGLVSFFADISSEMVYPLIPLYLTAAFGATPVLVGIIEGIAESVASLLKVFSGYISDKYNRKKPLAFLGYASGLLYKLALLFAGSWAGILGARVIDRFGKGIRTAPRDVMVSESADKTQMGKAFGIHKALDMAGSAIGTLLAFVLIKQIGEGAYKTVFAISILPVLLALLMFVFVKEKRGVREFRPREHFWKNFRQLNGNLKLYLLVAFLFTLGNSSNTFLLLKANDIGFSSTGVILLYFVYNLVSAVLAIPFGKRSDRVGRKRILIAGYLTFAVVYLGFAVVTSKWLLVAIFVLYGFYTAMVTGVERAFIAEIAPVELKGTMLGLHSTLVGIALLPASVIAGALWTTVGSFAPFALGALLSLIAALLLGVFFRSNAKVGEI